MSLSSLNISFQLSCRTSKPHPSCLPHEIITKKVATLIVLDQAHKSGVERLGHTEKLRDWLAAAP